MLKFLDCIELLRLALSLLRRGQRDQVPMTRMQEVVTLVTQSLSKTENDTAKTYLLDVLNGISVAQQNASIRYLPASMKNILVEGLDNALSVIADDAWNYYSENDVPMEHKDILRTIVEYHLFKGSVT